MPPLKVLVAEDDPAIRDLLAHHLEREGFEVLLAADGNTALRAARQVADLLILDLGLPAIDGFDIARTLRRERHSLPIVMLTARSDEIDRIVGFELGADDYVVKPFSPREVVARVKAVIRRMTPIERRTPVMTFGPIEIDEAAREVRVHGEAVKLKPREFSLLYTLASNAGIALSRKTLLDRVWGMDFPGDERTVDVHVRRLRLKLERSTRNPQFVHTVHGFGYKFARS